MLAQAPVVEKQTNAKQEPASIYKQECDRKIKQLKEEHDKSIEPVSKKIAELTLLRDEVNEKEDEAEAEKQRQELTKEIDRLKKVRTNAEYTVIAMMEAEKLWASIKKASNSNGKYMQMNDDEKVDVVRKDFSEFYNNFPIVSRYMVCSNQYKPAAFRKFLKLCESKLSKKPTEREEGFMQNQWIECQASYVQYLWEETQKHYDKKDSILVWQHAHKALTEEFKEFKQQHKDIEDRVKIDERRHKVELLKEVVGRISSAKQTLSAEQTRDLLNKLRVKKYEQDYSRVLVDMEANTKLTTASVIGWGANEYAQQEYDEEMKQSEYRKKYKKMNLASKVM